MHILTATDHARYSIHLWVVTAIYCLALVRIPLPALRYVADSALHIAIADLENHGLADHSHYLDSCAYFTIHKTLILTETLPQTFIFFSFLVAEEEIESVCSPSPPAPRHL